MTEIERARHDAAIALQRYMQAQLKAGQSPGVINLHDPDAYQVVDAISAMVITSIEYYLRELGKVSNGD